MTARYLEEASVREERQVRQRDATHFGCHVWYEQFRMCCFVTGGNGSSVRPVLAGAEALRAFVAAAAAAASDALMAGVLAGLLRAMTPLRHGPALESAQKNSRGRPALGPHLRAPPPPLDSVAPLSHPYHTISSTMADNVGLTTPRGSGTSGYVQKNRSLLRPRDKAAPYPKDWEQAKHRPRQPDAEILEHEAKREIEVKVFELRDKLEEDGYAALSLHAILR